MAQAAQAAQAQVDAEEAAARAEAEAEAAVMAAAAAEAATRHGAAAVLQARVRARRADQESAARAEAIDHRELLQRSAALRSWAAAAGLADDDEGHGAAEDDAVGGGAAPEGEPGFESGTSRGATASEPAGASTAQSEAELLSLGVPLLQQPTGAAAAATSREALPAGSNLLVGTILGSAQRVRFSNGSDTLKYMYLRNSPAVCPTALRNPLRNTDQWPASCFLNGYI